MIDYLIVILIFGAAALIIVKKAKDLKKGKAACGGCTGCSGCSSAGVCHKKGKVDI